MGQIVDQKLGSVGELKVEFLEGKLKLSIEAQGANAELGASFGGSFYVAEDPKVLVDKIIAAMPAGALKSILQGIEDAAVALEPKA